MHTAVVAPAAVTTSPGVVFTLSVLAVKLSQFPDLLGDMALFIAVGRAKSFSAAAKATAVPLSSLSRRISSMESRLGVRLLNRSSRNVQLTEQGRVFLERARSIVEAVRAAQDEVRGVAAHPRGRLRVSMPGGFGEQFLTPLFVA